MNTAAITRGARNLGQMLSQAGQKQLRSIGNIATKPVSEMSAGGIAATVGSGLLAGEVLGSHFGQDILGKIMASGAHPELAKNFAEVPFEQLLAKAKAANLDKTRQYGVDAYKALFDSARSARALSEKGLPPMSKSIIESSVRDPLRDLTHKYIRDMGYPAKLRNAAMDIASMGAVSYTHLTLPTTPYV